MHLPEQPAQTPKPAPPPQNLYDPGLSNLERVFDFQDEHFRSYMTSPGTHRESINSLAQAGEAMADHEHPVVRLAAAWAFAEAAMFRRAGDGDGRSRRTASRRNAALDNAQTLWRSSETDLPKMAQDAEPRMASNIIGLQLRAKAALIAVPAMKIVVDWRSGQRLSLDDIASRAEPVRHELLQMSSELYANWNADFAENPEANSGIKLVRYGIAAENVAHLILQDYRPPDGRIPFILLPASLRQDNNDNADLRADLLALDTERFHKKLIQVTTDNRPKTQNTRFVIRRPELQVDPGEGIRRTLEALIKRESGELLKSDWAARLGAMTENLGSRLVAFRPIHNRRRRR